MYHIICKDTVEHALHKKYQVNGDTGEAGEAESSRFLECKMQPFSMPTFTFLDQITSHQLLFSARGGKYSSRDFVLRISGHFHQF